MKIELQNCWDSIAVDIVDYLFDINFLEKLINKDYSFAIYNNLIILIMFNFQKYV